MALKVLNRGSENGGVFVGLPNHMVAVHAKQPAIPLGSMAVIEMKVASLYGISGRRLVADGAHSPLGGKHYLELLARNAVVPQEVVIPLVQDGLWFLSAGALIGSMAGSASAAKSVFGTAVRSVAGERNNGLASATDLVPSGNCGEVSALPGHVFAESLAPVDGVSAEPAGRNQWILRAAGYMLLALHVGHHDLTVRARLIGFTIRHQRRFLLASASSTARRIASAWVVCHSVARSTMFCLSRSLSRSRMDNGFCFIFSV